ncbi:hypothetical protein D9C73_010110 [Collichthys lucidus]|uniref:Uncharacterized protein n=1 Tax=Collichthys lucidus TaxID=240159 RepID=A0A4U5ULW1_COLLU|nr:hypothetical protein D9C73_010110 [Collichthys lucidus]
MDPYSRPSFIALTVFLALVSTGLTQVQDMLYFTVWTGNGENLMSHIEAIKEQANFFHKNRLVVDIGTKEHLQKTGALENSKVVLELDTDAFAKARAKIAKVGDPTLGQHYEKFYSRLQGEYESLRGIGFYASASDILRYVAFTAYSDQAEQLVYHDADVRFERRQRQTTSLGSGADMKLVMIGFTQRQGPSIANQLSFIEPSYFYERKVSEYPECVQFNTDLIFMQKSAATHSAVVIGVEQLRTIAASQQSLVEKVVGNEKTKMTLHDAIQTTHPEEARFVVPRETARLLYRNKLAHWQPKYTQANLKAAYTATVGLNPLDGLLQKEMDAKLKAAGPQSSSSHVEIGGEMYLRREEAILLRTLLVKGDSATVKSFISDSALSPADVGAVSRQDGQRWFDVTLGALSDVPDVPVYTLEEEAALADPDAGSPASSPEGSPLSSRENSRPPSPELPQDEAGLARPSSHELPGDVVDLSMLRFGREPPLVDPATEPEAFDKSIAACMRKNRCRREATSCSLYEEENFSARQDGEYVFQEKWPVTFTREDGSLRMIVESGVNAKNVKTRVVADVPKVLVEALARKRAEMVQTARAQLEEIMSNPAVEAAVSALGSDAHLSIPSEHARGVKRMGAAYAHAVTSGPKLRGVVKTWVLGTRAYGLFANIGAPVTKTFAALDLSQTVNGFMAHKLAQYAKTQDLAKVFSALADNPILNMAGVAANIFFFAQNVRNVAEGHRSPADYYWLTRSSMQMLTLVFDGLNPVMLPMVSVDALVILITQGEYATHVVRSVANKLPLSTGDVWKLGASSFFGSRSWSTYYENVASLESINGRLAQSLVEVLHMVNVAVGFPVSTVINEWHNRNGKLCVEGSVEVWPMITDSGHRASLAEADFSMESSVPLKEVYIGNSETQQLCYLMAKAKCSSPVLGWLKMFADSVAMSVGALPTDSECLFYDQSVPNATDPCGNMRKFLDDAVERKRLIPVTTEFGDPLLEPQLRAATVKAHKAKMISRPSGWMKEKRKCSRFLAVDKSRPAFLETRAPDASVFKASNCSQLRQLFTRRALTVGGVGTDTVIIGAPEKLLVAQDTTGVLKGGSAVSIDPEGVMLTCSVAANGGVYRSAYKDLSVEEGERFDSQDWRGKLEALVRAGLDEMTLTTPQGVKVAASASQQTVVVLSGNVTSVHQSFSRSAIEMDLVVDPDVTHCDVSLYGSDSSSTYCCLGSDCFHMGLRDVSRCDLIMSGVSLAGFGSTARVTVTAKGFGIAALKNRESGQYETPEGLELHSTLESVHTVRVVLSKDVTVVFKDVLSGMERVIPAHYGEVFLKRGYDKEDLLIQGVEMMIPSW